MITILHILVIQIYDNIFGKRIFFLEKKRKNYLFSIVGVVMHRQALISLVSTPPGPLDSFPLTPRLPGCPAGGARFAGPGGEGRQL